MNPYLVYRPQTFRACFGLFVKIPPSQVVLGPKEFILRAGSSLGTSEKYMLEGVVCFVVVERFFQKIP